MKRMISSLALLCLLFALPVIAGLDYPQEAKGLTSSSYSLSDYESINLANGNLNYHIPLTTLRTDGGLEYPVVAWFNSKAWAITPACQTGFAGSVDCSVGVDGLVGTRFVLTGIENYGFGWDLRPPRLKLTYDAGVSKWVWRYVDESGAPHRLQTKPWWIDSSGDSIIQVHEDDATDAVGEKWYTGDGTNLRFTVKKIYEPGNSLATVVLMEKPDGTVYLFDHLSLGAGLGASTEEAAAIYPSAIGKVSCHWDNSAMTLTAANLISFSYLSTMSDWDDEDNSSSAWLLDEIRASGTVERKVEFHYRSLSLESGGDNAQTIQVLDYLNFPEFDPDIDGASSNVGAQLDWSISKKTVPQANSQNITETAHLDSLSFPDWTSSTFVFDEGQSQMKLPLQTVKLPSGGLIEYDFAQLWPVSSYWWKENSKEDGDRAMYTGIDCGVPIHLTEHSFSNGLPPTSSQPGIVKTFGLQRRTKKYWDSLGTQQVETTYLTQALSCAGKDPYDDLHLGSNRAHWPYCIEPAGT